MKKKFLCFVFSILFVFFAFNHSKAADFDFFGVFTYDNDVLLLDFTVGDASNITIFSSSWGDGNVDTQGYVAGGGFDPILAIWNSSGVLVQEQDDGFVVGTTFSNEVAYSHGWWDSYFNVDLLAGNYTASITQYSNFSSSTFLSDGFIYDGVDNRYFTQSFGSQELFNGVWSSDDGRTGDWAFHILNVAEATQRHDLVPVPEPSTMLLLGAGLLGLAGLGRKRFIKNR